MSSLPFLTVMHNIDGLNISSSEIVKFMFFFTSEPYRQVLAFPKEYSSGINYFIEDRDNPITPSKYVHGRLKCCNDRFASNSQCIFHALDWIERNVVLSSIHFAEKKKKKKFIVTLVLLN